MDDILSGFGDTEILHLSFQQARTLLDFVDTTKCLVRQGTKVLSSILVAEYSPIESHVPDIGQYRIISLPASIAGNR